MVQHPPDIHFECYGQDGYDAVRHIAVAPEQIIYCGTVGMAFASDEPDLDLYGAGPHGGPPVAFFKIDHKFPQTYDFARQGDLGLRAFMVNHADQGQGWGAAVATALPKLLHDRYPDARALVLTVNIRNMSAQKCYQNAGFQPTGDIYEGGCAGPQLVMRLSLRA